MRKGRLLKLAKFIEEHPKSLEMNQWIMRRCKKTETTPCGTVGCIAGLAVVQYSKKKVSKDSHTNQWNEDIPGIAKKLLGLTNPQETNLFYDYNWPLEFREPFRDECKEKIRPNKQVLANITAQRIRHLVKTGE